MRGVVSSRRKLAAEVLVERTPEQGRAETAQLKRAMLDVGIPYECDECSIVEWCGQPLVLDIDHIDGRYWDNRQHNLRFLCPNCHRQTDTHGAKNIARLR